jgi:hypothetical protein
VQYNYYLLSFLKKNGILLLKEIIFFFFMNGLVAKVIWSFQKKKLWKTFLKVLRINFWYKKIIIIWIKIINWIKKAITGHDSQIRDTRPYWNADIFLLPPQRKNIPRSAAATQEHSHGCGGWLGIIFRRSDRHWPVQRWRLLLHVCLSIQTAIQVRYQYLQKIWFC